MSAISVQDEPSYDSTSAENPGRFPAIAKAAVWIPAPANAFDPVFKLSPSVQLEPSYYSDSFFDPGVPPKAKAAVVVPAAAKTFLPVFTSPVSV